MTVDPTAPTPTDLATSDPALLVPTDSTTAPVTTAPVTTAPVTTAPVTAREIAEFLRHLTDLRASGRDADPDARAAFLHRKTELFTRLAAPSASPAAPAPGRGTP